MALEKAESSVYSFDSTVFVKFIGRSDFSLARYHKLSLSGFSCFSSRPLESGEKVRVEINLKMITDGAIDDITPHIAQAEMFAAREINGKKLYQFRFIDFQDQCFDNLVKALSYLDSKEKIITLPVIPKEIADNFGSSRLDEIIRGIMDNVRSGGFVLPVLPKIVREVERVVNNPESTTEDLAVVVENDAVISVKILSIANSPFYRSSSHIVSIREAIPRLGFKEMWNLVLTIASKSLYKTKNPMFRILLEKLWKHSLACACCAREIARIAECPNPDNFYMTGLVHDIGQTLLFRFLGEMLPVNSGYSSEEIIINTSVYNPAMNVLILKHWGFSSEFIRAVMIHEASFDPHENKDGAIIHIATMLARNMGYDLMDGAVILPSLESFKALDIDLETLSRVGESVREIMEKSSNVF